MKGFATLDFIVFGTYVLFTLLLAQWVSYKKGKSLTASDYFLAGRSLPWWVIGTTLICANISTEQFIGMSGAGYKLGLAIASYEWMAALTLVIVAKWFLPIFLREEITTIPEFLERRFDSKIRTVMAVFWLLVYIFVNLTSILYMGAITLQTVLGIPMIYGVWLLMAFAALLSLKGGFVSIAWTDVLQVAILVIGGSITTVLGLNAVAAQNNASGFIEGFKILLHEAPDKFHMIFESTNPAYNELPGLGVLLGGLWVANLAYWGFNQYITQRTFAAKDLDQAQKGTLFTAYIKLFMPFLVVLPGIIAFVLNADISKPDQAYPWLMSVYIPSGLKGLTIAALVAAVCSSLASKVNSVATIFTIDLYARHINTNASEVKKVKIGRAFTALSLVIAALVAPQLDGFDQVFQFIQDFTGFITPGVLGIFMLGFFWRKTTSTAAMAMAVLTIPLSFLGKYILDNMPFLNRMGVVFVVLVIIAVIISLVENKGDHKRAIKFEPGMFKTSLTFNLGAIGVILILTMLYWIFW